MMLRAFKVNFKSVRLSVVETLIIANKIVIIFYLIENVVFFTVSTWFYLQLMIVFLTGSQHVMHS